MKKRNRNLIVVFAVIAVIIIAASIALRVILTEERLVSFIVPRAEKAMDARIELGDVRIEFPFGFGVEVEQLKVTKRLEGEKEIDFYSEKVEVKASLVSLIKRKPRLSRVRISESAVSVKIEGGKTLSVKGLSSTMSVAPGDSMYGIDIALGADSFLVASADPAEPTYAAQLYFRGKVTTAVPFEKSEKRIFPSASVDGRLDFEDLTVAGRNLPGRFNIKGLISLSENIISSEGLVIKSGKSSSDINFKVTFGKEANPEYLDFSKSTRIDISDIAAFLKDSPVVSGGEISLDLKGKGKIDPILKYVDSISEGVKLIKTEQLFKDFDFGGKLIVSNTSIKLDKTPVNVSGLSLEAVINRGSVEDVKSDFELNGRPLSLKASFINIMPAALEAASLFGSERAAAYSPAEFGKVFSMLKTGAENSIDITGSYIDLGQFIGKSPKAGAETEKSLKNKTGIDTSTNNDNSLVANPITLLLLKHSDFSVSLDSVATPRAVITSLNITGKIRDGKINIEPMLAKIAGGSVESAASVSLEDLYNVRAIANVKAEAIEAGKIISGFTDSGPFIKGGVDVKGAGRVNFIQGESPVKAIYAKCSIYSSDGDLDFSSIFSPLSEAVGIDLSKYKTYHYDKWNGNMVVSDGRVIIKDSNMKSQSGDILAGGSIGFDGTMNCNAKLTIPPAVQNKMKDLRKYGDLVNLFKDNNGNLVFKFDIGGTVKSPRVGFDQRGAREKAKVKIVDELKEKVDAKKIEELKKKAADKLKDIF